MTIRWVPQIIRSHIWLILIASVTGMIVTATIYNIGITEFIVKYVVITIVYFFLFLFFRRKFSQVSNIAIAVCIILTPLAIDASVLITNKSLVPLRFPFSSSFLVFGVLLAHLFVTRIKIFYLVLVLFGVFAIISWQIIIPSIIFNGEKTRAYEVNTSLLTGKYLGINNDTVQLNVMESNLVFTDFFFVGCAPCTVKEEMFRELEKSVSNKNYKVIFICDGTISTYQQFKDHVAKNRPMSSFTYLYDYDLTLRKVVPALNGFPFEIVSSKNRVIDVFLGFNSETIDKHIKYRTALITKLGE